MRMTIQKADVNWSFGANMITIIGEGRLSYGRIA